MRATLAAVVCRVGHVVPIGLIRPNCCAGPRLARFLQNTLFHLLVSCAVLEARLYSTHFLVTRLNPPQKASKPTNQALLKTNKSQIINKNGNLQPESKGRMHMLQYSAT